jgi:NADH-quinone oxidoreductase subunit C
MRENEIMPCDYLVDVTAVDYPSREKRFDVVYVLHSFKVNERVRLKIYVADNETIPSVTSLWPTANWLEREVFDMFGIKFSGHPDLKRILLPEGWKGHPLRKDYHIQQMDDEWVKANLNIETGQ